MNECTNKFKRKKKTMNTEKFEEFISQYPIYEYRLLDLYTKASPDEKKLEVFLYCDAYLEEFSDYIDDADADYYHQLCEMMARAYARREFENAWNELEEAVHKAVA